MARPLSEEHKAKLRAAAAARKAAHPQPTDAPSDPTPVSVPGDRLDFDTMVRRSGNLTLRQVYAQKVNAGLPKDQAYAESVRMLGGR